jgi:hypothetical protein
MADNPLKRLRDEIEGSPPPKKVSKANHTLYLSEPQFKTFRNYCQSKGIRPSEVIDRLIAMYLNEVKNDLPAK